MNFKKYIVLIVGTGLALVGGIIASVILVKSISNLRAAQSELKSTLSHLYQLNNGRLYPSEGNVKQLQTRLDGLRMVLSRTQSRLRTGYEMEEKIEPAQFGPLLEKEIKQLKARAETNSVKLPDRFAFGFDRYSEGALPISNAVPRLVTQLRNVAALCDVLYSSKISNVVSISREEFEEKLVKTASGIGQTTESAGFARAVPSGMSNSDRLRAIPVVAENENYVSERYSIEFIARENAVWEVLNGMAKSSLFIVVRDFVLDGPTIGQGTDKLSPARLSSGSMRISEGSYVPHSITPNEQGSGLSTNRAISSREDRIIAGREPVRVAVVVDVFGFPDGKEEFK